MKSNSYAPVTIDINSKDKTDSESSPEWFYNAVTKIYESNSNFFIPAIKLWQTYTSLFGASNEIGKAWMNMIVGWTGLSLATTTLVVIKSDTGISSPGVAIFLFINRYIIVHF